MFKANGRFILQSFALGARAPAASAPRSAADRDAEPKFIWPLAVISMLIVLVWALATEFRLPPSREPRFSRFNIPDSDGVLPAACEQP